MVSIIVTALRFAVLSTFLMTLSVAVVAQESAIEQLRQLGAKIYYQRDTKGKPTTKLSGIGIPYDWMGNDYSFALIRDIPRDASEQLNLMLIGPTTIPQTKIDELNKIPGWTVRRVPAVFVGVAFDRSSAVTDVVPESAADNCGIEKGDTILQVGETEVHDMESFLNTLLDFKPGDEVTITFRHAGLETCAKTKLTSPPEPSTR